MQNFSNLILHNRPTLDEEEILAVTGTINSGFIAQGKEVEQFEEEMCCFLGLPSHSAVAVSSGTAALYLALWALKAKKKIIALPVYTCSSLRNAIALIGGQEFLVDIELTSPNIDLSKVVNSDVEIVIVPHMFGIPVDISDVSNVDIVEDCAQALGARINNKYVGLHGRLGIFSFYATKLITTGGQGGMVVSKEKKLIEITDTCLNCRPKVFNDGLCVGIEKVLKKLRVMATAWDNAHLSTGSQWNKALTQCGKSVEALIKHFEQEARR